MKTIRRMWSILSAADRRSAVWLIWIVLFSALLEMLSVGLVVPALALMLGDKPNLSPTVYRWIALLGGSSHNRLVFVGLAGCLALWTFKVGFLLYSSWRQVLFVSRVQADVARRLFTIYLTQPWTFHLRRNSAELIRNITEITTLSQMAVAVLSAAAETIIMAGIVGLLVWFEPFGALFVGLLMGTATWILEKLTRHRLVRWGQAFQDRVALGNKLMMEGFAGAKDVKIRGCEPHFVDLFCVHRNAQILMQSRQMVFNQMPRLWYELLAVTSLCTLMAVMTWEGKTNAEMVPTLGLFATAAFRILPSINRVAYALQQVRYSTAAIDRTVAELSLGDGTLPRTTPRSLPLKRAIVLEDVTFRYEGSAADNLVDVSLQIPQGASVGIVGGSGAGKSTLVDVLLGLLSPDEGRVLIDGVDITGRLRDWQSMIGYVPQSIYLCDDTLRHNIAFGVSDARFDRAAFERALRAAQLDDFVASLPDGADTVIGERGVRLSGGQRQRVGIARALYNDPEVLVLDEATSALDTDTERQVMDAVEALHGVKTLVIVAHRLTTVAHCDVIYRLERGRVTATGSFAEVCGS